MSGKPITIRVYLAESDREGQEHYADTADMTGGSLRLYRDDELVAAYLPSAWHRFHKVATH